MILSRFRFACVLTGLGAAYLLSLAARPIQAVEGGEEPNSTAPRDAADAARRLELAERSLRQFDRVEYPLELRRLSDEIALAKAELDSFERQIAEYKRFPHDRYTQPFFFTLEQARLGRLEAELRWKRLREEKCRLIQFKGEHRRDRVLDVEEAQGWVEQFGGAKRA